jgi:redox-sensitive bicupin YhaK (pirin superfamily)
MGFGALRVINEDRVQPGQGFGTHGHRDMEIISYVLAGGLAHKDSMGNGSVIRPGDVQRMSAGTGVRHSEFNASDRDPVHFLQIWIEPNESDVQPTYEEKHFDDASKRGKLRLIASNDGREGSVRIHQDANLYAGLVDGDESVTFETEAGRRVYVHVVRGEAEVNSQPLGAGDAMKLWGPDNKVGIKRARAAEILVFDLA